MKNYKSLFFSAVLISTFYILPFYPVENLKDNQNTGKDKFQYLFPVPDSKLNSTETNIIIRHGKPFDLSILNDASALNVIGTKSGKHQGRIVLAENNKTLIFYPDKNFADGETITVELKENIKTEVGEILPSLKYVFETSKVNLNEKIKNDPENLFKVLYPELSSPNYKKNSKSQNSFNSKTSKINNISLPADFPEIIVDSINNPAPGNIFFTPFIIPGPHPTYLIITDNYGIPIFYRKMERSAFDFKKQKTGVLTYFLGNSKYYVMDSSYKIIDSLQMQNGYIADMHELVILENNHSLMMCYDYQQVAMDTIVQGGHPNATVTGLVIQELDENKNLIFQWRSWDHFKITDATHDIDLTDSIIDYVHGNAIEMDTDGNILISSRHLDEITKINRQTGDIIWRWGGANSKNNQFTFINDPTGFSHQHDIRRLPNGNLTLFDNGNLHNPMFSRAVEYQLDEENKIATLIWEYRNNPQTYNGAMGSHQRLNNHNSLIGWGWTSTSTTPTPSISEVRVDGTVTQYITLADTLLNYRAFKFPWKTNLFTSGPDSLNFGYVPVGDSLTKSITITNNSNEPLEINGLYNRDSSYTYNVQLPIIIAPLESASMDVTFMPKEEGDYYDDLQLRWDSETEGIAQVVPLFGTTDSTITDIVEDIILSEYKLNQNYPNPFNPLTKISYQLPEGGFVTLKIYDILGSEIKTLVNDFKNAGKYEIDFNASDLASGLYIYQIKIWESIPSGNDFLISKKMLLMK